MEIVQQNNCKVAILLSTYNGHNHVEALIGSICQQTYKDFTLYIRDDGSKDDTLAIIKTFQSQYPNVVLVESGNNVGARQSFYRLLSLVESDYYMFADQDDVWMNDKVELSVKEIEEQERKAPSKPVIVHTDLQLVDGQLQVISDSYWKYCRIPVDMPHKYELLCHFNDITGCAMIFNRCARDLTLPYLNIEQPKFIYHDYLVGLVTAKNDGIIIPIHKATIKFRRHGGNETNPLEHRKSILKHIWDLKLYIDEQHSRYMFYNQIKKQFFLGFLGNKIKTTIIKSIWKKKQE